MTDREQVINDLQDAVNDDWMWQHADFYARTMEKAIQLLKEQEAVEPVSLSNRRYACGNCGNSLWVSGQRFCASCGRKVKWDE